MSKLAAVLILVTVMPAFAEWQDRPDWAVHFELEGVQGTIAVLDLRAGENRMAHNLERAGQRYIPASTFKVPHALFALDAGMVRDEFQVFEWDGEGRGLEAWNRDQNLRSSMRCQSHETGGGQVKHRSMWPHRRDPFTVWPDRGQ